MRASSLSILLKDSCSVWLADLEAVLISILRHSWLLQVSCLWWQSSNNCFPEASRLADKGIKLNCRICCKWICSEQAWWTKDWPSSTGTGCIAIWQQLCSYRGIVLFEILLAKFCPQPNFRRENADFIAYIPLFVYANSHSILYRPAVILVY